MAVDEHGDTRRQRSSQAITDDGGTSPRWWQWTRIVAHRFIERKRDLMFEESRVEYNTINMIGSNTWTTPYTRNCVRDAGDHRCVPATIVYEAATQSIAFARA